MFKASLSYTVSSRTAWECIAKPSHSCVCMRDRQMDRDRQTERGTETDKNSHREQVKNIK